MVTGPARRHPGPEEVNSLRASGILATAVFVVMIVSDLLMLTTLEPARVFDFWADASRLPDGQVLWGYYLGELVIPFYLVAGWHLSLVVRPAGRWVSRFVLGAMAYAVCLLMVFHASFAFVRSLLRAGGAAEALYASSHLAVPLFRIACGVGGAAYAVVLVLTALGKTAYPRWALLLSPVTFLLLLRLCAPHVGVVASTLIGAAGWNLLGAVSFAASTAVVWTVPSRQP